MEYKKIEYRGGTIKVEYDESAESPKMWADDSVFLVGFDSRNFWVEVPGYDKDTIQNALRGKDENGDPDPAAEKINKEYYIFPVRGYVHSGVSLKIDTMPNSDSDMVHRTTNSDLFAAVLIKISEAKNQKHAETMAKNLLSTWSNYLDGEVYGYTATAKDGTEVGSCWGFYGDDGLKQIQEEAQSEIDHHEKEQDAKKAEVLQSIKNGEVTIYDSGTKYVDRYIIVHGTEAYGMSENPQSPQGFNQYIGSSHRLSTEKLGKVVKYDTLPEPVKAAIIDRLKLD